MPRSTAFAPLALVAALAAAGCSGDTPTTPGETLAPISVTESFTDSVNPNGGRTHPFAVERAGELSATLTSVAPDAEAIVGLSIGTWNGQVCQIVLANDNARTGITVTGSATVAGAFCVRVYDVGKLTANVEYTVTVTHF
jgi:hypothetical protein